MSDSGAMSGSQLRVTVRDKRFLSVDGTRIEAIADIAFDAPAGSFTALIGPSGCGKTTMLRIILGLDGDYDGEIVLPGPDSRVAAVFQEPRLLPWRDVETNVRLALPRDLETADLAPLFARLGLTGLERLYPGELSLGLARRVALARAFSIHPTLILLDEPFVSLDEDTATRLRALLLDVWRESRATALMVTHNLREALNLADRIVFLTPRPARLRGVYEVTEPRENRTGQWRSNAVAEIDALFPGVV